MARCKYILGIIPALFISTQAESGFSYNIENPVAINHGFTWGIDYEAEAKQDALLITTETFGSPKIGINVTTVGNGSDHTSAIRANLINNSISPDGNVAVYGNAVSTGLNSWQAAIHGEVRHMSGTSIGGNFEVANYGNKGDLYGVVINNVSLSNNEYHPTSGNTIKPLSNSVALKIQDDGSNWGTGIILDGNYNSGKAIDIVGDYHISINGHKVIGSPISGWKHNETAPSLRDALSEISTLKETIQTLNTLIRDLKSQGLIKE